MLLADGAQADIEEIVVGDLVMSWDEASRTPVQRQVTRTFVTPAAELMSVVLEDAGAEEVIISTPGHPWYVEGKGWTVTSQLEVGDLVPSVHGGFVRVGSTTWEQERATVYNFEVEGTHTYFVGDSQALVHNTCGETHFPGVLGRLKSAGVNAWESTAGLRYTGLDKFGKNRVQHVFAHLVPNAAKPTQTVFSAGRRELLSLIDEAWIGRGVSVPGDPGAFIVKMGRIVGTKGENAVRLIVRPGTSEVISAYPVLVP